MKFTLRQMQIFTEVAKANNVTTASQKLFLSQSATSTAIAELESQLNEALFDRSGKKLYLNEKGRALLSKAVNIMCAAKEIEEMFVCKGKLNYGDFKVATSSTIGNYLFPQIIDHFLKNYPKTNLALTIRTDKYAIRDDVLKFAVDIALIEGACTHKDIEMIHWKKDKLVVFASPKHPLASKKKIKENDLAEVNWILREAGSGTRETFEKAIYNKIDKIQVALELSNTEAVKQTVKTGLGIGCLSEIAISDALKEKSLVKLNIPFLEVERELNILIHKDKCRTDIFNAFLNTCTSFKFFI